MCALDVGADALFRPLTPMQTKILPLVAEGHSYKAIGDVLGISARTVEGHVDAIAMILPSHYTRDITRYRRVQRFAINYLRSD